MKCRAPTHRPFSEPGRSPPAFPRGDPGIEFLIPPGIKSGPYPDGQDLGRAYTEPLKKQ